MPEELVDRATQRLELAVRALSAAATDLHHASDRGARGENAARAVAILAARTAQLAAGIDGTLTTAAVSRHSRARP
jgi:hypothetical protein